MNTMLKWLGKLLFLLASLVAEITLFLLILWYTLLMGTQLAETFFLLPLLMVLGIVLPLLIGLGVHEFGHLLAALAMRLHVVEVIVGPLKVVREGRALRLRLNRAFYQPAGYVTALPSDDRNLRYRQVVYIIGGPLASFLAAILCLILASALNSISIVGGQPDQASSWGMHPFLVPERPWSCWLSIAGLANLSFFAGSIVPNRVGGWANDGAQLLELLCGGDDAERHLLVTVLCGMVQRGVRPREWNTAIVERLLGLRYGSSNDVVANLYGYCHALDLGDMERAGQFLDLAIAQRERLPRDSRPTILLEAAFFEAWHRNNPNVARGWLDQAQGSDAQDETRLRAEAAVLFAEQRYNEAAAQAEAALKAIRQSVHCGDTSAESEWLNTILAECRSCLS